jgi:hypothetical protein
MRGMIEEPLIRRDAHDEGFSEKKAPQWPLRVLFSIRLQQEFQGQAEKIGLTGNKNKDLILDFL